MLKERGYSAMINDSIIDFVIILGNIGGGILCMMIALLYCKLVHMSGFNTAMLVSLGAFTGYLLFSLSMEVVSSAVVAVYVCFAEKPTLFQVSRPHDAFIIAISSQILRNIVYIHRLFFSSTSILPYEHNSTIF